MGIGIDLPIVVALGLAMYVGAGSALSRFGQLGMVAVVAGMVGAVVAFAYILSQQAMSAP